MVLSGSAPVSLVDKPGAVVKLPVIVLTGYPDVALSVDFLKEGVVDYHEARFIDQIFEFSRMTVADIRVPRSAMFCLPVETPPAEIVRELVKSRRVLSAGICPASRQRLYP